MDFFSLIFGIILFFFSFQFGNMVYVQWFVEGIPPYGHDDFWWIIFLTIWIGSFCVISFSWGIRCIIMVITGKRADEV